MCAIHTNGIAYNLKLLGQNGIAVTHLNGVQSKWNSVVFRRGTSDRMPTTDFAGKLIDRFRFSLLDRNDDEHTKVFRRQF